MKLAATRPITAGGTRTNPVFRPLTIQPGEIEDVLVDFVLDDEGPRSPRTIPDSFRCVTVRDCFSSSTRFAGQHRFVHRQDFRRIGARSVSMSCTKRRLLSCSLRSPKKVAATTRSTSAAVSVLQSFSATAYDNRCVRYGCPPVHFKIHERICSPLSGDWPNPSARGRASLNVKYSTSTRRPMLKGVRVASLIRSLGVATPISTKEDAGSPRPSIAHCTHSGSQQRSRP